MTEKKYINALESYSLWFFGLLILGISTYLANDTFTPFQTTIKSTFVRSASAAIICTAVYFISLVLVRPIRPYIILTTVPIACALGLTNVMTGAEALNQNTLFYGFSFFAVTLAYFASARNPPKFISIIATIPALLPTGPILLFIKSVKHKRLQSRFTYYYPFFIIGVFFHQIISTQLTKTFFISRKTDLVSIICHSVFFEIFIYTNFAGLSLIIYSLFGIFGYRVPLNFRQPFSSRHIIDFWRGWHTSLSASLKQLFFIPVKHAFGGTLAILSVFLTSALWHGTSLNFLLWGAFHSVAFIATRYLLKNKLDYVASIIYIPTILIGRFFFSESDPARLLEKINVHYTNIETLNQISDLPCATILSIVLGLLLLFSEYFFARHRQFINRDYRFLRNKRTLAGLTIITIFAIQQNGGQNYAAYGQR